jgi:hypothetical protein
LDTNAKKRIVIGRHNSWNSWRLSGRKRHKSGCKQEKTGNVAQAGIFASSLTVDIIHYEVHSNFKTHSKIEWMRFWQSGVRIGGDVRTFSSAEIKLTVGNRLGGMSYNLPSVEKRATRLFDLSLPVQQPHTEN